MQSERKLNLVLDNARIHSAKFVEEMCDILSINLVFLPPYCPFLNPIEDVWKDIKRELYISDYKTLDELIDLLDRSDIEIGDIKQIACGNLHTFILKHFFCKNC